MDDAINTPQRTTKPGTFTVGDPRRRNGRPAGIPNKVNRPAKAILEAAQEEVARGLVSMTKAVRDEDPCPMCGRGMLRNEDTRIRASSEVLDRGGLPKVTQVETFEKPDVEWLEYATGEEAEEMLGIIERCRARMPINETRETEVVVS